MKYSNEQKQMFQQIADYIRAMPIGTVTTTARAMAELFPDDKENIWGTRSYLGLELFTIHFEVMELLENMGIETDMCNHDGKVEGLPYNFTFEITKKRA